MCAKKKLFLICGDEEYLKEQKKNELLQQFKCEGSFNYNVFSDEEIDLGEIGDLIRTMPFMEDLRKILIIGSGYFKGSAPEETLRIFGEMPDTSAVIFFEKEADRTNALYKLTAKEGEIFRFDSADSRKGQEKTAGRSDVRTWAKEQLRRAGRRIDSRTLFDLIEMTGYEMQNLSTELEKLICYCYDKEPGYLITQADVNAVCSRTLSDRIFEMMDLKMKGKTAEALQILEQLYALKIPPMRILYVIVRQYHQALAYTECREKRLSDAEIAAALGIKGWLADRLKTQLRYMTPDELKKRLEGCAEAEYRVKTGDLPEKLAVELLLIR